MKHLMLLLASLLWYLFSHAAPAPGYYVSFSTGNDANTAAQAQSPATPWQTLDKVLANINNSTIPTGATVFLKRGDAWLIPANFILPKSITIDSYGPGNIQPYVTSLLPVASNGWTLKDAAAGIWETTNAITYPKSNSLQTLIINGLPYAMGRTPNANSTNRGWLNFEAHTSTSITDNQNPFDNTYAGGLLVLRTTHANVERGNISSISGTTINFSNTGFKTSLNSNDGYGYFITNHLKCLDQFGEWFYNTTTHKVSLCVGPLNNPGAFNVQYPSLDTLIQPRASNITIHDINISGANRYVIYSDWQGLSNVWFRKCTLAYSGGDLVLMLGKTYSGADSCICRYTNSNAFCYSYHDNGAYVTNSTITDVGLFPGMLWQDAPGRYATGIYYASQNLDTDTGLVCRNNILKRIGHMAINFTTGNNHKILNNYVDTVCMIMDDGGGLYMENYTSSGVPKVQSGNVFSGNLVLHGIGAAEGTPGNNTKLTYGIYLDDYTNSTLVTNNTAAYFSAGIYLHDANRNRVEHNTFFNNETAQVNMQDNGARDSIYDDTIRYNILMPMKSTQLVYYMGLATGTADSKDYDTWGVIDSNKIILPFSTNVTNLNHFGVSNNTYNLTNWRSNWQYDLASTTIPVTTITSANQVYFTYNNNTAGTNGFYFPCDRYISVSNVTYFNSIMLKPLQSEILLLQNL